MSVVIREKASEAVLAEAREMGRDVISYEGNLYFEPSAVAREQLQVTDRSYTCPFKGTCLWVDFQGLDGKTVPNVAWVYHHPKPGHEAIQGRFGFYAGSRGPTVQVG